MADLKTELAIRMENLAYNYDNNGGYWTDWEAVAKECIRQMEWSRTQEKVLYLGKNPILDYPPLTVAPPDWNPNG